MNGRLRVGRRRSAVVVALVALASLLGMASPAAAVVTLAANPATDLVDGQVVDVQLTGLPAFGSGIGVVQCVGTPSFETCDTGMFVSGTADAVGNFATPFTVSTMLVTSTYGVVDCRVPPVGLDCVLAGGTGIDNLGVQTLAFDPVGPLRPAPTLVANPNTDLVDGQVVTVSGTGYQPGSYLTVLQCPTGDLDTRRCRTTTPSSFAIIPPDGSLTAAPPVRAQYFADNQIVDCQAAPNACELRVPGYPVQLTSHAPISFDPLGPPTTMPTLTVTPNTGLIDLQTVSVTGAGFPTQWPNSTDTSIPPVSINECLTTAPFTCVGVQLVIPDATGAIWTPLDVRAALWSYEDQAVHDCRPAPGLCRLLAVSYASEDLAALADLSFDPGTPLAPPPALDPVPATGLADGQIIDVTGSGFVSSGSSFPVGVPIQGLAGEDQPLRWNERLGVFTPDLDTAPRAVSAPSKLPVPGFTTISQCVASMPTWTGCDDSTSVSVPFDGAGDLTTRFQVHARITVWGSGPATEHDCRVEACVLRAGELGNPLAEANAPITFDPTAPLVPDPAITVQPSDGLVDGQLVQVTGTNFPWRPGGSATIAQCAETGYDTGPCPGMQYLGGAFVAEDGSFTGAVRVSASMPGFPQPDCRVAVGTCDLAAFTSYPTMVATVPLGFDPAGPLDPLPQVTVDPATDLDVGQQVTVTGRWFTSDAPVELVQCASAYLLTPLRCDESRVVAAATDDVGVVTSPFTLARTLTMLDGSTVDCTVDECVVMVRNPAVFGEVGWALLGVLGIGGAVAPPPAVVTPVFAG